MSDPDYAKKVHSLETYRKISEAKRRMIAEGIDVMAAARKAQAGDMHPMKRPEIAAKMAATLRQRGHRPKVRGGNGTGLTEPQKMVLSCLEGISQPELIISTGLPRTPGNVPFYIIDIAIPSKMLAIEVDGASHKTVKRRISDAMKTQYLETRGWKVLRFTNQEVLSSLPTVTATIQAELHSTT